MFGTIARRSVGAMLAAVVSVGLVAATAPTGAEATTLVTSWHVPVLMYHRIAPTWERGNDLVDLVLNPSLFDAQLKALKANGWHAITAARLAATMAAGQPTTAKSFVITLDDGRSDGYTHAFPILKKYGFVATFYVITGRVGRSGYLTWAQMKTMQTAGMEVGNHSVSHVDFKTYTLAQTDAQVRGAQTAIATNTGVTPTSFAYPFGYTYPNVVTSVKNAGIKIAFTTLFGARETWVTRLLVPRVRIHSTTTASQIVSLLCPYR